MVPRMSDRLLGRGWLFLNETLGALYCSIFILPAVANTGIQPQGNVQVYVKSVICEFLAMKLRKTRVNVPSSCYSESDFLLACCFIGDPRIIFVGV